MKAVVEVKSQLEDTSTAWRDNIHTYKRELSAEQEIHELDAETGQILPPELRAGANSNRHEMESSSEKKCDLNAASWPSSVEKGRYEC